MGTLSWHSWVRHINPCIKFINGALNWGIKSLMPFSMSQWSCPSYRAILANTTVYREREREREIQRERETENKNCYFLRMSELLVRLTKYNFRTAQQKCTHLYNCKWLYCVCSGPWPFNLFFPVLSLFDWVGVLWPQLLKALKLVCWAHRIGVGGGARGPGRW